MMNCRRHFLLLGAFLALDYLGQTAAIRPQPLCRQLSQPMTTRASMLGESVVVATMPRGGAGKNERDPMAKAVLPPGTYSVGRMLEFHKGVWLPVALGLMMATETYTPRAGHMTGMFGAYGLLWIVKSYTFWDKTYYNSPECQGGLGFVVFVSATLGVYFLYPYLAVNNAEPLSACESLLSTFLFGIGGFLHYAADAQKFFTLKHKGRGLITDGLFSRIRHPNYTGELMIWTAMSIAAGWKNPLAWLPALYLFCLSTLASLPAKEKSLSRYPDYEEWKKKTGMFLPKL